MNILHLKYAVEIARTGSLNKAAENLYMGQPNLSRAIKELEAFLGITIFQRSAKGMVATAEGERFLQYARSILAQIDEVEGLYRQGVPIKQKFSISVPRAGYISAAFARFSESIDRDAPAELIYRETGAADTVKSVLEGDCKLGILRYAENYDENFRKMFDEKGLACETVARFSRSLIMSGDSPLASKEEVRYDDLKPYIEVAYADPYVPSLPAADVMKEELPEFVTRRILVVERASQLELLRGNSGTFMWASPEPRELLERYDLVQKPCADGVRTYKDVLIYRSGYCLSELDKGFITELTNVRRQYM